MVIKLCDYMYIGYIKETKTLSVTNKRRLRNKLSTTHCGPVTSRVHTTRPARAHTREQSIIWSSTRSRGSRTVCVGGRPAARRHAAWQRAARWPRARGPGTLRPGLRAARAASTGWAGRRAPAMPRVTLYPAYKQLLLQ